MVLLDRYSSYCDAFRVSSESSADIVRFLDRIFSRIGSPNVVLSDNYMTCRSSEFQQFLSLRGVTHWLIPLRECQANGAAERCVRSCKESFRCGFLAKYGKEKIITEQQVDRFYLQAQFNASRWWASSSWYYLHSARVYEASFRKKWRRVSWKIQYRGQSSHPASPRQ